MASTPPESAPQVENDIPKAPSSTSRAVWAARTGSLATLCLVAGVVGVISFSYLRNKEGEKAKDAFDKLASSILDRAESNTHQLQLGAKTMATLVGHAHPDASEYPFVAVKGWEEVSLALTETLNTHYFSYTPIVQPEHHEDFVEYANEYYASKGYENSTITPQMWNFNPKDFHSIASYADSTSVTVPLFQTSPKPERHLFNSYSVPQARTVIDTIMRSSGKEAVGAMASGMSTVNGTKFHDDPTSMILVPVYPANAPLTPVGFVQTSISFTRILQGLFVNVTGGVDFVISSADTAYTYCMKGNELQLRGHDDLHQSKYTYLGKNKTLIGTSLGNEVILTLYPNDEWMEGDSAPVVVSITAVCILVALGIVFVGYDFVVHKEFQSKKDLLEAKRHFVRYVSHEVRTPLNSVCMGLTLIQEEIAQSLGFASGGELKRSYADELNSLTGTGEQKNARKWFVSVNEILESASGSVNVLNDMLNYDKIERGELALELTVVKIWKLIQITVDEFRIAAAKKKLRFDFYFVTRDKEEVTCVSALPSDMRRQGAVGDEVRLKQVLRNLLSNAIKFTPVEGSVKIRAALKSSTKPPTDTSFVLKSGDKVVVQASDFVQVEVIDTGAGMSEDQLARLYTAGTQFNKNKLQDGEGSGLGLFITNGIVKQHKGTLDATSAGLEKGTTFTMTLPLFKSAHMMMTTPLEQLRKKPTPLPTTFSSSVYEHTERKTLRLLVVDDVLSNRKLLARLLKHHGHHCDLAENGQVAVEMVAEAIDAGVPYHSVLLDYEMPVLNGPGAAKEIRSRKLEPCFIIGVTGNMLPDDVRYFQECGANAVLPKPFQYSMVEEVWDKNDVRTGTPKV